MTLSTKRDQLLEFFRPLPRCVIAFSGGVDSAVVAKAAALELGPAALAVTAQSASLASGELEAAIDLAKLIGIEHQIVQTQEFASANYVMNGPDRCYHCKSELYTQLDQLCQDLAGDSVVVNGANQEDLGDFRPGLAAAKEHGVQSPLADFGFSKADVRSLAAEWELPVWDKPASPCLSSRIAYGEEVTPERVAMVDAAEQALRALGLKEVRVRYHRGDLARLETPLSALPQLTSEPTRRELIAKIKAAGFKFITLDLEGFRSGSLNSLVSIALPGGEN